MLFILFLVSYSSREHLAVDIFLMWRSIYSKAMCWTTLDFIICMREAKTSLFCGIGSGGSKGRQTAPSLGEER